MCGNISKKRTEQRCSVFHQPRSTRFAANCTPLSSITIIKLFEISLSFPLKTEGKADRTAKVYKCICPIFRPDKTSLHQGLEKLSENRINGYRLFKYLK